MDELDTLDLCEIGWGGPSLDIELFYDSQSDAANAWTALMEHPDIRGPADTAEALIAGDLASLAATRDRILNTKKRWCYYALFDPIGNGRSVSGASYITTSKWMQGRWMTAIRMPEGPLEYVTVKENHVDLLLHTESFGAGTVALYKRLVSLCSEIHCIVPFRFASIQPELLFVHHMDRSAEPYITVPIGLAYAMELPIAARTELHGILTPPQANASTRGNAIATAISALFDALANNEQAHPHVDDRA